MSQSRSYTAKAIVVGFKKKGTWEDATQVPSEKHKEYWMRDSSLHLSRCHRHRTIQKKAKWANAYAPLLTSGGHEGEIESAGEGAST
jgi:hypothetical protein